MTTHRLRTLTLWLSVSVAVLHGTACGKKPAPTPADAPSDVDATAAAVANATATVPVDVPLFDTTPTRKRRVVTPAWPLSDHAYRYTAPPGDIFLAALPLGQDGDERGLVALTIPREAADETLERTLPRLHRKRVTALYIPPEHALKKGEDSELELLEELENFPQLPPFPALADSFSIRVEDQRLVSICFPTGLAEGYQKSAEPRVRQHCRSWLVDDALHFHDLDDEAGESLLRTFQADKRDAPAVGERFYIGEDGRLRRRVSVSLPTIHNEAPAYDIPLEYVAPASSTPELAVWHETSAALDVQAWAEGPLSPPPTLDEAFRTAAQLLALRAYSAGLDKRSLDYLAIEADALQRIAATLVHTYDPWSAWAWLAQLHQRLDDEANGVLPRPSAMLLLVDEANEIKPLRWRGIGYTLHRHTPPHWERVGDTWMLHLQTTRGVRVCSQSRCERYSPTAIDGQEASPFPSLQHPQRPIQALSLWRNERGDEIIFTGTDRAHACDLTDFCNSDGRCTIASKATIERQSKFDGPLIHRQRIPSSPVALSPSCAFDAQTTGAGRLAFWRDNGIVISAPENLRQFSPQSEAYNELDPARLTAHERMIAGVDDQGARYYLRALAGELSVWRVDGETATLMPLAGLHPVAKPVGDSGWVIPSPDGRLLAVVHGGTVLGVWPMPSPDDASPTVTP